MATDESDDKWGIQDDWARTFLVRLKILQVTETLQDQLERGRTNIDLFVHGVTQAQVNLVKDWLVKFVLPSLEKAVEAEEKKAEDRQIHATYDETKKAWDVTRGAPPAPPTPPDSVPSPAKRPRGRTRGRKVK